MAICTCNVGLSDTGRPGCEKIPNIAAFLVLVEIKDSDGNYNSISESAVIDDTYIDALVNNADSSKKWFPVGEFKNVEDIKNDTTKQTLNDGTNIRIREGSRSFTGSLFNASPVYLEALKSVYCVDFGVFIIDIDGSIYGKISADGTELRPIRVDKDTFDPKYMKTTDSEASNISVYFEFNRLEKDEDIRVIGAGSTESDLTQITGVESVTGVVSNEAVTSFTLTTEIDNGAFFGSDKDAVKGLVAADFSLYNEDSMAVVVVLTATESSDGVYDITYATQPSTNTLTANFDKDYFQMDDVSVLIP